MTLREHFAFASRLLRAPRATLETAPEDGALKFAAISYACVLLPSLVFLYFASMVRTFPTATIALVAALGYGAAGFALLMTQLVLSSALEWLALRALGQKQATFGRGLLAHALSESAMVLGLVRWLSRRWRWRSSASGRRPVS